MQTTNSKARGPISPRMMAAGESPRPFHRSPAGWPSAGRRRQDPRSASHQAEFEGTADSMDRTVPGQGRCESRVFSEADWCACAAPFARATGEKKPRTGGER